MRLRIRKGSRPYKILKTLSLGAGVLIVSTISPMGGAKIVRELIKSYFRQKYFKKYRFLKDLKNLQNRDLLDYRELDNGQIKMTLTKNGRKQTLNYKLDEIKLQKTAKWDGRWRLVMFDIPHYKRRARDAFRMKLKSLEFYPLQRSVFITPYPCEQEIDFLASIFEVRRHVILVYGSHFEGQEKLKHHFKL